MNKTITVLGAGYVGLTTAALLSNAGYTVYIVEPDLKRLESIKRGHSFFFEQGIDEIIRYGLDQKTLVPTNSYEQSVPRSSVVFSCVGTPDNPDGSSNLTYIFSAASEALELLPRNAIYVQKSTVPVGTGQNIIDIFAKKRSDITYVSNPEFLRESTAIFDTLWFDRVVVGSKDPVGAEKILNIYRNLQDYRKEISERADIKNGPDNGVYISTNLNSAELIKVTSNAFLALKISFANSIAMLSDAAGANINEVMDAVGADTRIGRAFLNAGRGYGGGCFPKDVSGLISSSNTFGIDMEIMKAAQNVNDSMPGYIIKKLLGELKNLEERKIAILGLAFKAGTSDVRKSPGISLANLLKKNGADVRTYDPQAKEEASRDILSGVLQHDTIEETVDGVDAVIIATEWPEIIEFISNTTNLSSLRGDVIIDAVNKLPAENFSNTRFKHIGIGK
jgi:UDPglucose 6-dehydrogenase